MEARKAQEEARKAQEEASRAAADAAAKARADLMSQGQGFKLMKKVIDRICAGSIRGTN